jgi:nucleoside-diphosphate-sugar epimerase
MKAAVMNVFVTGGSGYVGGYVIRALRKHGHRVHAMARSATAAKRVEVLGAKSVLGDLDKTGAWRDTARDADAIIHLAAPSPYAIRRFYEWAPLSRRWVAELARLEAQALPALIDVARESTRCRALIATTGPAAAGDHGERWIDEDAEGPRSIFGQAQRDIERRMLAAAREGIPATVLRPGAVYGPDGGFAARVLGMAERGQARYVGSGSNYTSWVHIDDYAEAYVHALSGASAGQVVAVVDDEPMTSRASIEQLAALASHVVPDRVPVWMARLIAGPVVAGWATQSARLRNTRARALGWEPRFATIREGFPDVLARFRALAKA